MSMTKGAQTRDHILKATRKVIATRGFYNTPVREIIRATGVKKGNLYYHFASKEELGLAVLMDAKDEFVRFLDQSFVGDDPVEQVIHHCDAILREQQKNNFVGGCLFGNTALEMSDSNSTFAAVIREVFDEWIERLIILLEGARSQRLPASSIPAPLLAKTIVATIEGGIMMSRISKDKSDLDDCLTVLKAMLGR